MNTLSRLLKLNYNNSTTQMNKLKNGRVNIMGHPITRHPFPLYQQKTNGDMIYKSEALKTILVDSDLSNVFFSHTNINILQTVIRYRVWIESGKKHIISNQSSQELKTIMRSIFLQYGKFQNNNITKQVKSLNEVVIEYTVPNILSNIELYLGYKQDISHLPIPLTHPVNLSVKGPRLYD